MRAQFLSDVLPSCGLYCSVGISGGIPQQRFHESSKDVAALCDTHASMRVDAYFALASFTTKTRKAQHVQALRSLFVDLDVDAEAPHKYATFEDAHEALQEFCTRFDLPQPWVVASGGGVHAYWPLNADLEPAVWGPLARRFKAFCLSNGLRIDRAVTADAARILRMPGTVNTKFDPPQEVRILATGEPTPVAWWDKTLPRSSEDMFATARANGAADAFTPEAAQYPPTSFARIVRTSLRTDRGCGQIKHALQQAATLEEPLWRAALSIAYRCEDGETAIHKISKAHPEYDAAKTVAKAQGTAGPATCQWYKDNYPAHCAGCALAVTSPIAIGRVVKAAEAVEGVYTVEHAAEPETDGRAAPTVQVNIPSYPYPYFRGVNGGVFLHAKDKDGEPIEITVYPYDLYLTGRYYDESESGDGDGEMAGISLHTPRDGIRTFSAPVAQLLMRDRLRDTLLRYGVIAINKDWDAIMTYFASSLRHLQKSFAADRTRHQMGWTLGEQSFVLGELEYVRGKPVLAPASTATRHVAAQLHHKGTIDEWRKVIDFYAQPGLELHAFAILTSFAAPLLRLTDHMDVRGATINLMSNSSGTGKTTAQMVANSVWGHPAQLLLKKDDTFASKIQWIGLMNNLPVTMDEVTNLTDEELSELAYDIPQGRGRHRMESAANKLRANNTNWMTFVITSSNSSMYDKLMRLKTTPDGEIRRILELRIERPASISKEESDRVFSLLTGNYGVAGPIFIHWVMNNREAVTMEMDRARAYVDKVFGFKQEDRFYAAPIYLTMAAARIAGHIGLHDLPIEHIMDKVREAISTVKAQVVDHISDARSVSADALSHYILEYSSRALIINSVGVNGLPPAPLNDRYIQAPIGMRYEPDADRLWIPVHMFRKFCTDRQIDFRATIDYLRTTGVLLNDGHHVGKRITEGLVGGLSSGGTVKCYELRGSLLRETA